MKYSERDILADWKTERFIIADQTEYGYDNIIIVLCDITFWDVHYDDLAQWCLDYDATLAGMTVELSNQQQLTAFCLRWR